MLCWNRLDGGGSLSVVHFIIGSFVKVCGHFGLMCYLLCSIIKYALIHYQLLTSVTVFDLVG